MNKYDIVIIGSGPGGYPLATLLAKKGKKVALIEKDQLGGTCINVGCIPTKSLVKSAYVLDTISHSQKFGIETNLVDINVKTIQNRRQLIKQKMNNNVKNQLNLANVDIYNGTAKLIDQNNLIVNEEQIQFDKAILATGAKSREIDLPGANNAREKNFLINSNQALIIDEKIESLTIIGSGPVALEFAYIYSTFGTKVTIIDVNEFMGRYDVEFASAIKQYLTNRNIEIIDNVKLIKFDENELFYNSNGQEKSIKSSKILSAIGRVANLEAIGNVGIELNEKGFIKVNDSMQTNIKNIYALGDATGLMMLSSVAYKTSDIIAKHILGHEFETLNTNFVPWSIYLNPEISGVGQSEKELTAKNVEFEAIVFNASSLPRNLANGSINEFDFIKFLIDKKTGLILGAQMFLEGSSLVINQIAQAMQMGIKFADLQKFTFTHPTVTEAIYYLSKAHYFAK
ncbi:thioredoxin reductase [Mycoplasmopsis bovigenitalium]|uniref:Thioredoxin reductase n=1 Tax=Mycoplasmopsis bovigenitalium TaxID=2112 RepID=A0A449A8T8_9BACT|nr:dihydrolipoyl dehydrogenase [Mycoplasmopsis bovigenitalium]VEU60703.1 thioredoxin reductase [Mycoplasmopsis bovigenitalium]